MKIYEEQKQGEPLFYAEVDSNYKEVTDGKGMNDAVSFLMGQYDANGMHELDTCINVGTSDARKFAQAILELCDQIDRGAECKICGKVGQKVRYRSYGMESSMDEFLCDDCYHETEGDEKQMEREQREEW